MKLVFPPLAELGEEKYWYIQSSESCWVLGNISQYGTEKEAYISKYYYTTFKQCVKKLYSIYMVTLTDSVVIDLSDGAEEFKERVKLLADIMSICTAHINQRTSLLGITLVFDLDRMMENPLLFSELEKVNPTTKREFVHV